MSMYGGFPVGSVGKKPPDNAEDTGSIPGLGRSHMLWSKQAGAPQLWAVLYSLSSTTRDATAEKPSHRN